MDCAADGPASTADVPHHTAGTTQVKFDGFFIDFRPVSKYHEAITDVTLQSTWSESAERVKH